MFLEVRDWIRRESSYVLVLQKGDDAGIRARWMDGGPTATPLVTTRRIWFEPPGRLRVEIVQADEVVVAAVRDGDAWWRWNDDGETVGDITQGAALPPVLDAVQLNPTRLLATTWLEVTGTRMRASRDVLAARGTSWQDPEAPTTDFEFDLEHGTPLYVATSEHGQPSTVSEVITADYQTRGDPSLFRFELRINGDQESQPHDAARRPPQWATADAGDRSRPTPHSVLTAQATVWLTGLSGAGKTTIARATERLLHQLGATCCVLDGDEIRQGLSSDLGLSRGDRGEQTRRVAHVAALLADSGVVPIVALISPYAEDRERARQIHEARGIGFLEVWVDTPLDVCTARDPKGLYAASRLSNGEHKVLVPDGSGLTGISAPYQAPTSPSVVVSGEGRPPRHAATQIVEQLITNARSTRVITVH
jgi:adenylyl-sulfate kinase